MDDFLLMFAADWLGKPVWAWLLFLGLVGGLLAFDLGILHKDDSEMSVSESLKLSAFYIGFGLLFGVGIWVAMGADRGMEYFTGFFIEKSLSIDNVFVISLIFSYFAIPPRYQYRALLWGIVGVIVLRGLMIGIGAALVQNFAWVMYVFGAFLIATGVKMLFGHEAEPDMAKNPIVRVAKRLFRVTPELHGERFFVRARDPKTGRFLTFATPLFLALIVINVADIVFAVDSVPAIFAITRDTFVVYTANIMAILGLRALYFALAAMVARFQYLKYALALVLVFIGTKIFAADMLGLTKIPPWFSLLVTAGLIGGGVLYSIRRTRLDLARN
jgi:tellurite resistance protein TerC